MPIDPKGAPYHFANSDELCKFVRDNTGPEVILWFSAGRDSIGAWLKLRRFFDRVIPVYRYFVPHLGFVEESLKYYEDFFQTKIHQYPHQDPLNDFQELFWQSMRSGMVMLRTPLTPKVEPRDTVDDVRFKYKCPLAYNGVGQRSSDSMHRRNSMKKGGVIDVTPELQRFYPIFDWTYDDLDREFRQAKIKLPVDYKLWNRSFDGVRYRFFPAIRKHYPKDWERICLFYPRAELELWRRYFWEQGRLKAGLSTQDTQQEE